MTSNFSRLDPGIREYIYEKKWQALKGFQEETIPAVLDTQKHILIAAGTASGKTEACFFPVITELGRTDEKRGIQVLYIGPLKALINDQFERLAPLLQKFEIKLWRWHGDVERMHKRRLLENPEGILQITPESLEALLLRQPSKINLLFRNLKFIIIDEVHAFTGTDRGAQLLCLFERIRYAVNAANTDSFNPRRIGLSATLGNYTEAAIWLAGCADDVIIIDEKRAESKRGFKTGGRRLSLAVDFFGADDPDSGKNRTLYNEVYDQCRGDKKTPHRKCIIFTNSRLEAEEAAAALKKIASQLKEKDHCHVHHGSIAAALRAETEKSLRENEGAQTIAATATLELGIDIGKLDRIIQIGAPMSVASFIQRLGRSGRRSGVSQMYFCSQEAPGASAVEKIPWTLLKTIAVIELYLEHWTEDYAPKPMPFSLLCHEILCVLASGELDADELRRRVLSLPPFSGIEKDDYDELVSSLEASDYIEKTEEGKFITGLEGERLLNHYSFYSVFPDEEEFRVTCQGRELGRVNFLPPEGAGLVLGGRNWKVCDIRLRGREICVVPGSMSGAKIWRGGGGAIHQKIVSRMRQALLEKKHYRYLTVSAAERLRMGREFAEENNLGGSLFVSAGESESRLSEKHGGFYFIPWLGSGGMRVISLLLQNREIRESLGVISFGQENPHVFRIESKNSSEAFSAALRHRLSVMRNPEEIIDLKKIPFTDKYDFLLPQRLLIKQYAANMLDTGECGSLFV